MIQIYSQNLEKILQWYIIKIQKIYYYGGWNNELFEDISGICVSVIVGPSYSVKSIYPIMGRISENQDINQTGSKLNNGNITVYFILGSKYDQTSGILFEGNNNQLTIITPVFSNPSFINPGTLFQGTKDCEVYIKIDKEEWYRCRKKYIL